MKQLTGLDASFLYMETGTTYGHVNGLAIYDRPDDPDFDPYEAFMSQIERRLHMLEPFRRRLVPVPMGLDHPYWINDPDFDLEFHIRHIAIPPPGDHVQLATQVARIIGRPMDRSRPLWEAYVLEGLPDNQFAVLSKTHHATVDGAAGVEMLGILLDHRPEGDDLPPDDGSWKPEQQPSDVEMLTRSAASLARRPRRAARVQLSAVRRFAEATRQTGLVSMVDGVRDKLGPALGGRAARAEGGIKLPSLRAPKTPWNKSIGPHRRFAMRSVPMDDIKTLKNAAGATVNDVVMAMCTTALRNYLMCHDALPEKPLVAMVPVSIRTGNETDTWTNRVSQIIASLPTHLDDPLERLQTVHQEMVAAKKTFDLMPAETMVNVAQWMSPMLATQAARLATSTHIADRVNPPINVVLSNVPGPREPLYMGGAQMTRYFPVSTIAEGVGLNLTVHSYMDSLDIGLVADRELVPDLEVMADLHLEAIDELFKAMKLKRKR
ncbi:MAG: wax ester/triacylglycerol synthase family O-acyltransferase [Actinobacteria bacterium]|nr:wax ester/triacylglycerol synthase family O-acyltransferase [Actinomycetota bacterium]